MKYLSLFFAGAVVSPAVACEFGYEDLLLGTQYDTSLLSYYSFSTDGLYSEAQPFFHPIQGVLFGIVTVVDNGGSCGTLQKLYANKATIFHDFTKMGSTGALLDPTMVCKESGAYVTISINGEYIQANDLAGFDGLLLGGVEMSIQSGGNNNTCTTLALKGVLHTFSLGGMQVLLDCIDGAPAPPEECSWDFDSLQEEVWTSQTLVNVGTADRPLLADILPFGVPCSGIYASSLQFGQPCLTGGVLSASCARYRFMFDEPVGRIAFTSTDAGGDVLLGVNGAVAYAADFSSFNGGTLGGASINVIYGSIDGCTRLEIVGDIAELDIGGSELWFDCLLVEGVDGVVGDMNADGRVDGADLAVMLGRWGTPAGDLTGDEETNGADLAVLLGAWSR